MADEALVPAIVLKPFTSIFGNHVQNDKLNLTQHRFNVWKEQGLIDHEASTVDAEAVDEMPEPTPKPKAAPKKKAASRKGKARK